MTLACPVGHPSSDGMKSCPLCGRKYVKAEQVVLPPTKEEALARWRADRRAAKAAALAQAEAEREAAVAAAEPPAIPAARASSEALPDVLPPSVLPERDESTTWTMTPIEVAPRLLAALAGAGFVTAFALGESTMLALSSF